MLLLPIPTRDTAPATRVSGSCPPQVVELIPPEVPEAFGSCRKFRHVPQVVGVGSGAGMVTRFTKMCNNCTKGKSTSLELIHAAGILQKRSVSVKVLGFCSVASRTCPAARGRSLWAFPAPMSSNYTPAPVGSLWGCCALCEPVGAVRKSRSACADLCRNVNSSLQKKPAFQGWGSGSGFSFLKNAAREPFPVCREVTRSRFFQKKAYF